jgi:3-deoxy-7-phosphoheptulonate synthase
MNTLITPEKLHRKLPFTAEALRTITEARSSLKNILSGKDNRMVVVIGPCSIHDPKSALEYAERLRKQIQKHQDTLCIIMRTYFEKARTSVGWKGLLNDPELNQSFELNKGLEITRSLLLDITAIGVPVGAEIINPLTIPYFSDLLSWSVIGARTTESQLHREIASHLPTPVGFKNNTNGDIQVAIDAVLTAQQAHHFLHVDHNGQIGITQSAGNPYCHIVLRGSNHQSNYDNQTIDQAVAALNRLDLTNRIMIDCSHGNSQKNPAQQLHALRALCSRITSGDARIFGVMSESHLMAGKQPWIPNQPLQYGQSITDACIGWADTEIILDELSQAVSAHKEVTT